MRTIARRSKPRSAPSSVDPFEALQSLHPLTPSSPSQGVCACVYFPARRPRKRGHSSTRQTSFLPRALVEGASFVAPTGHAPSLLPNSGHGGTSRQLRPPPLHAGPTSRSPPPPANARTAAEPSALRAPGRRGRRRPCGAFAGGGSAPQEAPPTPGRRPQDQTRARGRTVRVTARAARDRGPARGWHGPRRAARERGARAAPCGREVRRQAADLRPARSPSAPASAPASALARLPAGPFNRWQPLTRRC